MTRPGNPKLSQDVRALAPSFGLSHSFVILISSFVMLAAPPARAQWQTQSFTLKPGWNAVYLLVDAGYADLDRVLTDSPIDELWLWDPAPSLRQNIGTLDQATAAGASKWKYWRAGGNPAGNTLAGLFGNVGCLVHNTHTADFIWRLTGIPVPPRYQWTSSGQNFIGFSTPETSPPDFWTYLKPAPDLQAGSEIYRYMGGAMTNNPVLVNAPRNTPVTRGEAYWVRAQNFNSYFHPFDVTLGKSWGVDFGQGGRYEVQLHNRTATNLTVTVRLHPTDSRPPDLPLHPGATNLYHGQTYDTPVIDLPWLLVRGEFNTSTLAHDYSFLRAVGSGATQHFQSMEDAGEFYPQETAQFPMPTSMSLTLAANERRTLVLGIHDLSFFDPDSDNGHGFHESRPAGTLMGGILRLTDSLGLARFDLPVRFQVGTKDGLYVGEARIDRVRHNLTSYARDADGSTRLDAEGRVVATNVVNTFGRTSTSYPLRLIYYQQGRQRHLLQRAYVGFNTNLEPVLATSEALLPPENLGLARRISAVHLPWTTDNQPWPETVVTNIVVGDTNVFGAYFVTNTFDSTASNPFLHTFHPDHDNKNASFTATLPRGAESYDLVRQIQFYVSGSTFATFESATDVAARTKRSGDYEETVRVVGKNGESREFQSSGTWSATRLTGTLQLLTNAP